MKVEAHNTDLMSYEDVLKEIRNQENHLLVANGFNYGLGVKTGYKNIFEKMIDDSNGIYEEARSTIEECNYDLEAFLKKVTDDISGENSFLKKYTYNKIKFDFMKALHNIVKSEIKHIYEEQNEGIFMLLKNFTNFFTLNYDSFLYILLLRFKLKEDNKHKDAAIAFLPTLEYISQDLNSREENIYKEIKAARESGLIEISVGDDSSGKRRLSSLTKSSFVNAIKDYNKSKGKGWKSGEIDRVVKIIIEEEEKKHILQSVDDGFKYKQLSFVFDEDCETQNLFFLHGAFHIIKEGNEIRKITQDSDKALYQKLEEIINNDEKDIVCVFQSENKIDVIQKNPYLLSCYNKLSKLNGNIIIIGSSLDNNDSHIFNQINNSNIKTVYISSLPKELEKNKKKADAFFTKKQVRFFNADSISYKSPEQHE